MKKSLISTLILCTLVASSAYAERKSGSVDKHRMTPKGSFTRHTEQVASDTGFTRNTVATRANGDTATRTMTLARDKEAGTRIREMSGTNFNGESYSGLSTTQKTDTGFTRDATFTNAQGKTASRHVDAVVNKDAGTVTKNISVTKPNGETTSKTVVKTAQGENSGS